MSVIGEIIVIALLCIFIGGASIPIAFTLTDNPVIVWTGNALGSALSALVVVIVANKITDRREEKKLEKKPFTKKIVTVFEEGDVNKKVKKARILINKHGLRLFSLICPIFPGVLISTVAVYALNLERRMYFKWMMAGVVLVSGFYVFSYWFAFVK